MTHQLYYLIKETAYIRENRFNYIQSLDMKTNINKQYPTNQYFFDSNGVIIFENSHKFKLFFVQVDFVYSVLEHVFSNFDITQELIRYLTQEVFKIKTYDVFLSTKVPIQPFPPK